MLDDEIAVATTAERRDLAGWLVDLNEASLATPSLCAGWDVRTVGAHLAVAASGGMGAFLWQSLRHGGLHRGNDAMARAFAERPVTEIATTLRSNAEWHLTNPGVGSRCPMTDLLVHLGDVRRPLGLPHEPAPDRVTEALVFLTSGKAFGFVDRKRLAGVRLVADDIDFTWGSGQEVHGRAADLMMAACGRHAVLPDLAGPGVEALRVRPR